MKIAAIQHDIVWEDADVTRRHVAPMVAEAAGEGAELILLTEMFATGFSMDTAHIAEPANGPTVEWLAARAVEHGAWVGATVSTRLDGEAKAVNRFTVAGSKGQRHHYDKIHPFTYGGEHEFYRGGDRRVVVDIGGVRVGLFVCYDLRFADEFWPLAPDVDLYLVPANWPAQRREHWRALLVARAIENQAYVVGVNRVGEGGGITYAGDSLVVDPLGTILADGAPPAGSVNLKSSHTATTGAQIAGKEQILMVDIDLAHVRQVRQRFPFLQDRR